MTDRIALISDIHGNLTAFRAVLADIHERGIERIINLGDFVGKGPRGQEAADLCREVCEVNLRGNWEDFLPAVQPDYTAEAPWWWRRELRADQHEWLRTLPLSHDLLMSGRCIRLFHASAHDVHTKVHVGHTRVEFDAMFAATTLTGDGPTPTMVGYGDIHDAYLKVIEGRTLFNVGSVGNSLDEPRRPTRSSRARSTAKSRGRSVCSSCACRTTSRPRFRSLRILICRPGRSGRQNCGPASTGPGRKAGINDR